MSILDYIGIPYKVRGEPPHGADCYSLVRAFAEHERGILLPEYMYSAKDCYLSATMFIQDADAQMADGWRRVEKQPDCVVVFRVMGLVMHCGWMLDNHDFLHAFEGRNSCVESIDDFYWAKRIGGFYRYG